ncbi:hypothetical protein ACFL5C_00415 [Candidatus Omnitrophota bacterium]
MSVSFYKRTLRYLLVFILSANLALCPTLDNALAKAPEPENLAFQRGMCYADWNGSSYSGSRSKKSIKNLKKLSVDHVEIIVTQYQDRVNSLKIKPLSITPTDSSIKKAIEYAHSEGMKVMLKPHIDLLDDEGEGYWRGDIGFYDEENWEKWFDKYEKFITHYAELAEKTGVEIFCVGTELAFAAQKTAYWRKIIANTRKVYSGKLVYASNWDNYMNIEFWDDLDYAGIDAYFPLSHEDDPSLESITMGWKKWLHEIKKWQSTVNKPVLFTEIGYPSSIHAPNQPWASGKGKPHLDLQAKLYTAFFEAVGNEPWLAGVYWWQWGPDLYDGGKGDNHFTPMNKPAAAVVAKYYEAIGVRGVFPSTPTVIAYTEPLEEQGLPSIDTLITEKIAPLDIAGMGVGIPTANLLAPPIAGDLITRIEVEVDLLPNTKELTMKNGNKYRGEVLKNYPDGRGIMYYKNGDRYGGDFKNGMREGKGVSFWKNGNIYAGEFSNGSKRGTGVFFWKNGNIYSGEFNNDLPHGIGTELRNDGSRYQGEFKLGYPNGKGVMLKKNGDKYEGEFKNGLPNGHGILTKKNGDIWEGEFIDGYPQKS